MIEYQKNRICQAPDEQNLNSIAIHLCPIIDKNKNECYTKANGQTKLASSKEKYR